MKINKIRITNFKSIYSTTEFDFNDIQGLVKLSGNIGSGKTTLGEAVLFGLYGSIKGQNNPSLKSWNTKYCEIELWLETRGRNLHIIRNTSKPLEIYVDNKLISGSSKRDSQEILETEFYDVPRLAIERMCVISFNQFKSLANMSPADIRTFLDEVFGFKLFTDYNDVIVNERKNAVTEHTSLETIYNETANQIDYLNKKKANQKESLKQDIDIDKIEADITSIKSQMDDITNEMKRIKKDYDEKLSVKDSEVKLKNSQITEYKVLGRQEKEKYNLFKDGVCPTCGHAIDAMEIDGHKAKMLEYAANIKDIENEILKIENEKKEINDEYNTVRTDHLNEWNRLNDSVSELNSQIATYNASVKLINENYDTMISEAQTKLEGLKRDIASYDKEIGEWNEMNELFSKTLRYSLLDSLIPQINSSIQYFINKFDQPYIIEFDQEFKSHIRLLDVDNEIAYSSLSTGQKKTLDIAIILGILHNIINSVEFNILFLDELFSNIDANGRNNMLQIIKDANAESNRSIFIINHAEMQDDLFDHKIRVKLHEKQLMKKKEERTIKESKYDMVF